MSTLSAQRQTPPLNSRLTGDRPTPNRRRRRQAGTGEADFPRREREQDAIPSPRLLTTQKTPTDACRADGSPTSGRRPSHDATLGEGLSEVFGQLERDLVAGAIAAHQELVVGAFVRHIADPVAGFVRERAR